MGVSELLADRLKEKGMAVYALHRATGYKIAHSYLNRILKGEIHQVSVEKLRIIAQALGDPINIWLDAAGYLDGLPAIEEALRLTYGDMIQDPRVFKHVQALAKLSPENRVRVLDAVDMMINQRAGGSSPPRRTSNFSLEKSLITIRRLIQKNQFGYTFGYICCIFNAKIPPGCRGYSVKIPFLQGRQNQSPGGFVRRSR